MHKQWVWHHELHLSYSDLTWVTPGLLNASKKTGLSASLQLRLLKEMKLAKINLLKKKKPKQKLHSLQADKIFLNSTPQFKIHISISLVAGTLQKQLLSAVSVGGGRRRREKKKRLKDQVTLHFQTSPATAVHQLPSNCSTNTQQGFCLPTGFARVTRMWRGLKRQESSSTERAEPRVKRGSCW